MCTFTIRAGNTHREFVSYRDGATFETVGGCSIWGLKQRQSRRRSRFTGGQVTEMLQADMRQNRLSRFPQLARRSSRPLRATRPLRHAGCSTALIHYDAFIRYFSLDAWLHYFFTSLLLD